RVQDDKKKNADVSIFQRPAYRKKIEYIKNKKQQDAFLTQTTLKKLIFTATAHTNTCLRLYCLSLSSTLGLCELGLMEEFGKRKNIGGSKQYQTKFEKLLLKSTLNYIKLMHFIDQDSPDPICFLLHLIVFKKGHIHIYIMMTHISILVVAHAIILS
ncbi:hypothetical protein ACJX0J_019801, partial [Zea mays]